MANVSGTLSTPTKSGYSYTKGDCVAAYTMSGGTTTYIIRNGGKERVVEEMPDRELAALKRAAAASGSASSRYSSDCSSCGKPDCDGHNG